MGIGVTSGQAGGMSGLSPKAFASQVAPTALASSIILAVAPINASSTLQDADRFDLALQWWEPITWQGTSAVAMLPLIVVVATALRAWPMLPGRMLSDAARHAALTVPFSLAHVLGMVELRRAIYAFSGLPYDFASSNIARELIYEWRKDSVTYLLIAAIFFVWQRHNASRKAKAETTRIEIRDGKTSFSLDPCQILSVYAEGNYVRIRMDQGSHLIRGALIKWEKLTTPYGFWRIHRSALVNPRRVRSVRPAKARDFEVILDDGTLLRGSRRYRQDLFKP